MYSAEHTLETFNRVRECVDCYAVVLAEFVRCTLAYDTISMSSLCCLICGTNTCFFSRPSGTNTYTKVVPSFMRECCVLRERLVLRWRDDRSFVDFFFAVDFWHADGCIEALATVFVGSLCEN